MPALRLIGNSALSFITKASSGYWNLMDPTNGFTAIHSKVVKMLPLQKLEHGFFFESDMLFRLNTIRAVVKELPMQAVYQDEISNLHIARIATTFPAKHLVRFLKRIFYNYYLRGFNPCSIELIVGSGLLIYGTVFGLEHWQRSIVSQVPTPLGTIMVAALSVILGVQMLLAALSFDVGNIPKEPLHPNL
jgi:hypothetical protein